MRKTVGIAKQLLFMLLSFRPFFLSLQEVVWSFEYGDVVVGLCRIEKSSVRQMVSRLVCFVMIPNSSQHTNVTKKRGRSNESRQQESSGGGKRVYIPEDKTAVTGWAPIPYYPQ